MPLAFPVTFGQQQIHHLAANARDPITVTAGGTAHTKGNWTQLIASTAYDAFGIWVHVQAVATSAAATAYLVDIGVGPSGSEQVIIPNLNVWGAHAVAGRRFWFPVYIPAGSRISARSQSVTTSKTCGVAVFLDAVPWYANWGFGPVVDYGTNLSASAGTSVTAANGAWGSWVQVGTTIRDHTFWTAAIDGLADTTLNAETFLVEVAVGTSTVRQSLGILRVRTDGSENIYDSFPMFLSSLPVPSGSGVWVRLAGGSTEARGVIVYAM